MELLLLVEAFAWVLALLAGATGLIVWVVMQIVRSVTPLSGNTERSSRRTSRPVSQWDPGHPMFSKRAGQ